MSEEKPSKHHNKQSKDLQTCADCGGTFQDKNPRKFCKQCEKKPHNKTTPSGKGGKNQATGVD